MVYRRFHAGIDLAAPSGTLIKAADGGEIIYAGYDGGYGYSIMVYHGGGFATWYAHCSRIIVSVGQTGGKRTGHRPGRFDRTGDRPASAF